MGLILKNNFLLVKEVSSEDNEFSAMDRTDKFEVAISGNGYKKGQIVYIPAFSADRVLKVDGEKYHVVEASEVVAHVA